jgi:hypothetical protein
VPNYKKANWEGIKQDLVSSRDNFIAKFESGTNMDTIEENWKQFKEAIETCRSLFPIGGHVVVVVTSVGCDVIMRSNILSFRVGNSLICSK